MSICHGEGSRAVPSRAPAYDAVLVFTEWPSPKAMLYASESPVDAVRRKGRAAGQEHGRINRPDLQGGDGVWPKHGVGTGTGAVGDWVQERVPRDRNSEVAAAEAAGAARS